MDWRRAYTDHDTPWDLRQPTPPLEALLRSGRLGELGVGADAVVAVPGCGRGHDVRLWARCGHPAVGFDIVPEVVAEARALLRWNGVDPALASVHCRDLLGLGVEFGGRFDLVYDYTCLCALPPHLRRAYGREMAAIVKPGGAWLGLVFPMESLRPAGEGPPFVVRAADLEDALGSGFTAVADFPAERSVPQRAGMERWFFRRRR